MSKKVYTRDEVQGLLRSHGINPTLQRVEIAHALFSLWEHVSAEDVFAAVNAEQPQVSKATVYNTLGLFAARGLIREVIADPSRVFYDPNTSPHYHFYDETTGRLMDIDAHDLKISGMPPLPDGTYMEGVDVIVRLRHSRSN